GHNIPDPALRDSASSRESELSKRLYQLRLFDKVVLFSARPELRHYAMRQRVFTLKHIATELAQDHRFDCATYYARQALMPNFTFRWLSMTMYFSLRWLCSTLKSHFCNKTRL